MNMKEPEEEGRAVARHDGTGKEAVVFLPAGYVNIDEPKDLERAEEFLLHGGVPANSVLASQKGPRLG